MATVHMRVVFESSEGPKYGGGTETFWRAVMSLTRAPDEGLDYVPTVVTGPWMRTQVRALTCHPIGTTLPVDVCRQLMEDAEERAFIEPQLRPTEVSLR